MKVVVIGGAGLIGSQVVVRLGEHGHEAVPASPNTGANTMTLPGADARTAETHFDEWAAGQRQSRPGNQTRPAGQRFQ